MRHSRSSLFLMEMIIAILFFSLASAVCIQLFAKSHTLSVKTVNQNHAVIQAQNLAESYLAYEGNMEELAPLFEQCSLDTANNTLTLFFDAQWNPTQKENAVFQALLAAFPANDSGLITADITVSKQDSSESPLYTLQIVHHIAERRGDHE